MSVFVAPLVLLLVLASVPSAVDAQSYSLSPIVSEGVTELLALEASLPNTTDVVSNVNPGPHPYPFSNPTLPLGLDDPQLRSVNTTSGQLLGQAILDSRVTAFTGIPYAQPPVGELRWLPPVPYTSNDTINATSLASWCTQIGPLDLDSNVTAMYEPLVGSEDCLYVSVWTPADLTAPVAATLPVLVFIHGGAYITLSGGLPDYDGFSWSNASDVIIVTFDYRLTAFGFFASTDLDAEYSALGYEPYSGNQALLDQQLVLQWVQSNIAAFGGQFSQHCAVHYVAL